LRKLGIGLAFLTGLGQLGAQPSWAVQVDLAGSLTQNLKDATGDRVGLAPGLVLENPHSKDWALRGRAEAWTFGREQSTVGNQTMETRLSAQLMGVEAVYAASAAWHLAVGLHEARWQVESHNRLDLPGGTAEGSGRAHWNRAAWSLGASYQWRPGLALEGRLVFSHYGVENRGIQAGLVGICWQFAGGKP